MEWFKYYFGSISDFAQGVGAIAALVGVIIAYLQLRKENKKRDEEIKNLKTQTSELKNLYILQSEIRKQSIRPIIETAGSGHTPNEDSYHFINKGKTAFYFNSELVEKTDGFDSTILSPMKRFEPEKSISVKIVPTTSGAKYLRGLSGLEKTIFKYNFFYEDEDGNRYKQVAQIKDGNSSVDEQIAIIK